jgi:hypothetical protein
MNNFSELYSTYLIIKIYYKCLKLTISVENFLY